LNPKVFVSHASEDTDRFVLPLATRLRERGIDAWVDKWEINPGDSLVDKLFEEGLKQAEAVIIVLSRFSVTKPWVREELNASIVKRIQKQCKIIPVVIDDCEVPECLKATVWQRVSDIASYDAEFDKIVSAVYGHYEKPPLGAPPTYVGTKIDLVPGLTKTDSLVLKLACEKAIELDSFILEPGCIAEDAKQLDISEEQLLESLEVLGDAHVTCDYVLSGEMVHFSITDHGFGQYASTYLKNFDEIAKQVAACLVNQEIGASHAIAEAIHQPHLVVEHILNSFEARGYLQQIKPMGGGSHVWDLKPQLKRWLRHVE
jgi:hypothetical protein